MHEEFMRKAIQKAWEGYDQRQEPFGSCIVKNKEIISITHNTILREHDPTAHAEMNAIRDACKKLRSTDLHGCSIYATFKPCEMCMEAIKRAKITHVYYGAGPEDIEYSKQKYKVKITPGILKEPCLELTSKKYKTST